MLYYHYGSKHGLYVEVLRDMFRAVGVRARAIADGPGTAEDKLDAWIATIVEEAAARPWFPPIMLREIASGGPTSIPTRSRMMNAVYAAVRDVIVQGQREGVFRDVDPLLTHLTIMPAILIFFARQRVLARSGGTRAGVARRRARSTSSCGTCRRRARAHAAEGLHEDDSDANATAGRRWLLVGIAACREPEPSNTVRVSGHVEATEVQVAPEVGGRLVELRVAEGDRVDGRRRRRAARHARHRAADRARAGRARPPPSAGAAAPGRRPRPRTSARPRRRSTPPRPTQPPSEPS